MRRSYLNTFAGKSHKGILLLLFVLSFLTVNARIEKRRVIASAGRLAKNLTPVPLGPNYSMSYTLGEPFIYVNTPLGYSNTRMCNGFQQPDALIAVGPSGLKDKRQFDESALSKIILNAIQDQQRMIEEQNQTIQELMKRIEVLEKK